MSRPRAFTDVDQAYAAELLGDALICAYCGATLATFDARCLAERDDGCPGSQAFEQAVSAAALNLKRGSR